MTSSGYFQQWVRHCSKQRHSNDIKLFSTVHPRLSSSEHQFSHNMAHKTCHVGYKHAGLHCTDYRTALQVENKLSFTGWSETLWLKLDVLGNTLKLEARGNGWPESPASTSQARWLTRYTLFVWLYQSQNVQT